EDVSSFPARARQVPGASVSPGPNRAVARLPLFQKPADSAASERLLLEALDKHPTRLLASSLFPNHWHLCKPRLPALLTTPHTVPSWGPTTPSASPGSNNPRSSSAAAAPAPRPGSSAAPAGAPPRRTTPAAAPPLPAE